MLKNIMGKGGKKTQNIYMILDEVVIITSSPISYLVHFIHALLIIKQYSYKQCSQIQKINAHYSISVIYNFHW